MKIGVFSDLHSNVFALEAMLAAAPDAERWISLGDAVGLFPPINATLDRLRALDIDAIRGNHETCLLSGEPLAHSVTGTDALARQRAVVSAENAAFVTALPDTRRLDLGGRSILAVHALPAAAPGAGKYAMDLDAIGTTFSEHDLVLFGDTHLPTICHLRSMALINPGSAGFPIDITRRPSFAVVDTGDLSCELRRFDYDAAPLIDAIRAAGYNAALVRYLQTGVWGS